MITKNQAISAKRRDEFHHILLKNADGSPLRCRANGACKTWKTRPEAFKLPVKYGLRQCFYITEANAHEWTLAQTPAQTLA